MYPRDRSGEKGEIEGVYPPRGRNTHRVVVRHYHLAFSRNETFMAYRVVVRDEGNRLRAQGIRLRGWVWVAHRVGGRPQLVYEALQVMILLTEVEVLGENDNSGFRLR